ncbi:hypothetical protein [Legionella impletisoli]|uniref:Uncharacterized protein n=1 Tax=Legionella impletisoli TaxID=343510 RepID=A0A917JQA1_9GAMM|nr:hypothetical protein [Legionella impletisoli]GGI77324.1 hypothetical protein GCM10007966_02540 [Legionella impletisoli]
MIKLDTRGVYSVEFNTRHHVMLVIDIKQGQPIIAHMRFTDYATNRGKLVIEPCPSLKDVYLIRCEAFSQTMRQKLTAIVLQAHEKDKLRIDNHFLRKEYQAASEFRALDSYHSKNAIEKLRQQPSVVADVLSEEEQLISCHSFVLSTIHLACRTTKTQLPHGLNIPPQLAWSDFLYATANDDKDLSVYEISSYYSNGQLRFFPRVKTNYSKPKSNPACSSQCVLM